MAARTRSSSRTNRTMPGSGRWTIDSTHSFVFFVVEHYTIAFARGIATGPTGTITIGEELNESSCEAVIDAQSITTANQSRDQKMRGPDLLDVEKYPTINFASTSLTTLPGDHYKLDGNLTIRGITKPISLDLTFNGVIVDSKGNTRVGLTATTDLHRNEFDAGDWGHVALAAGGFMVPHIVKIILDIEATKDQPQGT